MKINWILLSVALLLVFSASSFAEDPDSNMVVTAKISTLWDDGGDMVIYKDSTIELEIYFYNNWGNSAAISLPFYWFEETGGTMNVNYLGTGDFGIIDFRGSAATTETFIKEYNGWTDYWPAMILHDYYGFGLDKSLPDTINFTGADLFGTGWIVEDTTLHIGLVMQILNEGVFCVDSCQIPDGTPQPDQYNWLFEDTSYAFFGSIDVPSTPLCWEVRSPSDVQELEKGILPTEFDLGQNYPNPFNPSTKLEFAVPHNSNVNISVFNILGQKITTLVDNEFAAGYYSVDWDATSDDGSEVASGIYFYKIEADNYTNTKKLMLIR